MKRFWKILDRKNQAIKVDILKTILSSNLFDEAWYQVKYPEVKSFPGGPLAHFCEYGLYEHRDPGPNFDTRRYLTAIPEAGKGPLPPVLYALATSDPNDGRPPWLRDRGDIFPSLLRTSGIFDETWYLETYPDVARSAKDAFEHYVEYGAIELRDPGPNFDSEHYALRYPNYQETFPTPIEHYLRLGLHLGYNPTGISKYGRWLSVNDELTSQDCERIAADAEAAPTSLLCVHVVDTRDSGSLGSVVKSLNEQVGASWRSCFLRGPNLGTGAWWSVRARVATDSRIVCVVDATCLLSDLSDGHIILLCAGSYRLRPHACHVFTRALSLAAADASYSDHDRIDQDKRRAPVFKPAMSPCFMQKSPYCGPVIAVRIGPRTRTALAIALTALDDPERAWADLLLAFDPARVIRIPLILYHLPCDECLPEPRGYQPVPKFHDAIATRVLPASSGQSLTVRIIIPTRDRSAVLKACVDSILATTDYPTDHYKILIVDNGSVESETARYLVEAQSDRRVDVIASPGAFNFSRICNDGAFGAEADILVFLNNDMTVRQADWLSQLVGYARQPEIGAVGAQLLYPDDTVQHGGVVLGIDGVGAHSLVEIPADVARTIDVTRELSAVTGACIAIRNAVFRELGGFDPLLQVDFNDVDLCCAALKAGYRNLYIAEPLLHHHESLSRGAEENRVKRVRNVREAIRVRQRHAELIRDDPGYNPNLSLVKSGALAVPPRVVPPWRRPAGGVRRVLLLRTLREAETSVAQIVADEAAYLTGRGFEVIVGGPEHQGNGAPPGCRQVALADALDAAVFATREGVDAIIAHTAPFFSVTRHLGRRPLVYAVDHGDPPPGLFPDREARENAMLAKRFDMALAKRVFATSTAVRDSLIEEDAILLQDGRVPATTWSDIQGALRSAMHATAGPADGGGVSCGVVFARGSDALMELTDMIALDLERDSAEHWI